MIEPVEDMLYLLFVNADPRVFHIQPDAFRAVLFCARQAHLNGIAGPGEFHSVGKEVVYDLVPLVFVELRFPALLMGDETQPQAFFNYQGFEPLDQFLRIRDEVAPRRFGLHPPAFDLGQVEHLVDQAQEVAGIS